MYIDPKIERFLNELPAQNIRPPYEISLAEARIQASQLMLQMNSSARPIHKVDDIFIPGVVGDIRCKRYLPRENKAYYPVLVYYHGGGTILQCPEDYETTNIALALEADCLVITPNYRLAPENPFPAPLEDSYAVFNWLQQHAEEIGGDSHRIAIAGDSGGGYLAAAVALEAKRLNTPQPLYQILIYPMLDNASKSPSYIEMEYFINEKILDWFIEHAFGEKRLDPRVTPILAKDHRGLAPAMIITAALDPLRDCGKAYANKLRQAGVPTTYHCYDGMIHGFFSMGGITEVGDLAVQHVASVLRYAFRQ